MFLVLCFLRLLLQSALVYCPRVCLWMAAFVPAVVDGYIGSFGRTTDATGLGMHVPGCILPHILPVAFSVSFWIPPLVVLPYHVVLGFPIGQGE